MLLVDTRSRLSLVLDDGLTLLSCNVSFERDFFIELLHSCVKEQLHIVEDLHSTFFLNTSVDRLYHRLVCFHLCDFLKCSVVSSQTIFESLEKQISTINLRLIFQLLLVVRLPFISAERVIELVFHELFAHSFHFSLICFIVICILGEYFEY